MAKLRKTFNFFEKNRRKITAAFAFFAGLLILLTRHSWDDGSKVGEYFFSSGVILILMGIFGRLWSTAYIGGRKNASLVKDGPYSMCRNPLYFSSFLAGLGVALLFQNLILVALYLAVFSYYYPNVIKSEERRLHDLFGEDFLSYKADTPAFIPSLTHVRTGGTGGLPWDRIWRTLLDGSVFLLFIPLAYIIDRLQNSGVIRVFWRIP